MPLSRFAFLRHTVRNHPVIAATTAATGGVLLGAFVAVQLLATPKLPSDSAMALAAVETKAAPKPVEEIQPAKPVAETTGSAATGENAVSADCEQQTWPYLSRACMEEYRAKNRSARVVTTDKLDKPAIAAIETQPPVQASAPASPIAVSPAPALPLPPSANASPPAEVAAIPAPAQQPKPAPAPAAAVASVTPATASAVATPQPDMVAPPAAQPARASAKSEAKEKRRAHASKRKWKAQPKAFARQDVDDDGETLASVDSDERDVEDRRSSRSDRRSHRIVERWTERDYDVPDSRGGRRQVTVIRRNSGGDLFESLFGN